MGEAMKAPTWEIIGERWRSPGYLAYVRSLGCRCQDPRCPNCQHERGLARVPVQAAHLRMTGCGMGVKPDDFMVYPLSAAMHELFHRKGHPGDAWQMDRVIWTWREAFRDGIFCIGSAPMSEVETYGGVVPF
jgi:hypothetical protein